MLNCSMKTKENVRGGSESVEKSITGQAMNLRLQLTQALQLIYVVTSSYMFWKGLSIVTNSHSPIVVVLSGSMEPAFQRGDILFLWNREQTAKVGDIVVYEVPGKTIPIVHRVLREHTVDKKVRKQGKTITDGKKQLMLTKGDNNAVDDLGLYNYNQNYLDRENDIVGVVKGYFPLVGYITLLLTENQYFKYALLGLMGISTLLSKEQ